MKYHDYHINEYRVSNRGATITFDLVYGYPENETDQSTTIIVLNYSENIIPVKLDLDGQELATTRPYITSGKDTHKLYPMKKINLSDGFEMPPRCIITFTSNL